jgi:hypothetical protein
MPEKKKIREQVLSSGNAIILLLVLESIGRDVFFNLLHRVIEEACPQHSSKMHARKTSRRRNLNANIYQPKCTKSDIYW